MELVCICECYLLCTLLLLVSIAKNKLLHLAKLVRVTGLIMAFLWIFRPTNL
jgi:hypothetical protein